MSGFIWTYTKKSTYKCPNCGQLRANRFENSKSKELAPEIFAKCNRMNKCGYEKRPNAPEREIIHVLNHFQKPVLQPFFMPENVLAEIKGDLSKNTLFKALCNIFEPKKVRLSFELYKVGTDSFGATIYPQIDRQNRVRTAKKIIYMSNGKRNKCYGASFLHVKYGFKPEKFTLKQCLFGEHLLNDLTKTKIFIVESEKTALICEICNTDENALFLASGGLQNLSFLSRTHIESGRKLILIPDNNADKIWMDKINKLGIRASVHVIEKIEGLGIGYDIADVLIYKKTNAVREVR